MLGGMGPSRRAQFGLSSNEQLFNPNVNARAAFKLSKGGTDFGAWGVGPNAYRQTAPLDTSGFPGGGSVPASAQTITGQRPMAAPGRGPLPAAVQQALSILKG